MCTTHGDLLAIFELAFTLLWRTGNGIQQIDTIEIKIARTFTNSLRNSASNQSITSNERGRRRFDLTKFSIIAIEPKSNLNALSDTFPYPLLFIVEQLIPFGTNIHTGTSASARFSEALPIHSVSCTSRAINKQFHGGKRAFIGMFNYSLSFCAFYFCFVDSISREIGN